MKDNESIEVFKRTLDEQYTWPSVYMFKFIVPTKRQEEVYKIFPGIEVQTKESTGGKYVSLTASVLMKSSDEVIAVYVSANQIEGLIAL